MRSAAVQRQVAPVAGQVPLEVGTEAEEACRCEHQGGCDPSGERHPSRSMASGAGSVEEQPCHRERSGQPGLLGEPGERDQGAGSQGPAASCGEDGGGGRQDHHRLEAGRLAVAGEHGDGGDEERKAGSQPCQLALEAPGRLRADEPGGRKQDQVHPEALEAEVRRAGGPHDGGVEVRDERWLAVGDCVVENAASKDPFGQRGRRGLVGGVDGVEEAWQSEEERGGSQDEERSAALA